MYGRNWCAKNRIRVGPPRALNGAEQAIHEGQTEHFLHSDATADTGLVLDRTAARPKNQRSESRGWTFWFVVLESGGAFGFGAEALVGSYVFAGYQLPVL